MTQEIRIVYKDTDKSVVGFIDAEITYEEEIKPTLEKDGVFITEETLIFEDGIEITNNMLEVNSEGIPSIKG